jgi:hypothetical protein
VKSWDGTPALNPGGIHMTKPVTGTFDSMDKIWNAKDDLIATGIPQEKIYVDEDAKLIRVMVPEPTKREIFEILKRHDPLKVN